MHTHEQGGDNREPPFVPSDRRPFLLTPLALKAVAEALQEEGELGVYFRVTMFPPEKVISPRYALECDFELRPGDVVVEFDDIKIVADHDSIRGLRGTVIDYSPEERGFSFNNPNEPRHRTWDASGRLLAPGERLDWERET
jgi:Fe-S cluster assembly iron-binding protein IscA